MLLLYPRLPKLMALELAVQRAELSVKALVELSTNLQHPSIQFAPSGGTRVTEEMLRELQTNLREIASRYGYPSRLRMKDSGDFDKSCARFLYEKMGIKPVEASNIGMWVYLTVVLLPDVVRWRFFDPNGATSLERYIGSARGMRRNAFGRMWWRAHLFYLPINQDDPYLLIGALTEDDQIQISERPSLSGSPRLAREVAVSYLTIQRFVQRQGLIIDRRVVLREALKRLSRLIPITLLDMLDEKESQQVIDNVFRQTVESITALS